MRYNTRERKVIPMPVSEAKTRAKRKWDAANLDRIQLIVKVGEKDKIKAAAAAAGETLNHYMVAATKDRMRREGIEIED